MERKVTLMTQVLSHDHECPYCGAIWSHDDPSCTDYSQLECDDCVANPDRSDDFLLAGRE